VCVGVAGYPSVQFQFCSVVVECIAASHCKMMDSSGRLAPGWTVWESNPGGGETSAPFLTGPGSHADFYTVGSGSTSRGQSGRGVVLTTHHQLTQRLKKE
jgi:hypothetical protein